MARRQFPAVFDVVFKGSVTGVDISNAATGSGTFGSVTAAVPGVAVGDFVFVAPRAAMTAGSPIFADVSAANTVRFYTLNNSAGAVDYASATYDIVVLRGLFS